MSLNLRCLAIPLVVVWSLFPDRSFAADRPETLWAEIQVVDKNSGRSVPLVELETVNGLRFVTDNAGRVAFYEPGLMDREVYFSVRSHGYAAAKDGFGFAGVRITPRAGEVSKIEVARQILAERLCRLTGEGLYRDSLLLGYACPFPCSPSLGLVAGQDSIQAVAYRGSIHCFWGDTSRMSYPLGLFRTAGATLPIPDAKDPAQDIARGLPYRYHVDGSGFARPMIPLRERPDGVIWIDGVAVVPDESGNEVMIAHYSRRKGLADELEQGIARFNDDRQEFEVIRQLPLEETWRRPSGHSTVDQSSGTTWLLFGNPQPTVRVPARLEAVLDPAQYEAFTCRAAAAGGPRLDDRGRPDWRWQRELPPVDSQQEAKWIKAGQLGAEDARFFPADAANADERILLHNGTVRWNSHRRRWIMLAGQLYGKPSLLGEVWYAEAEEPTGPFRSAVRVLSHDRQTFYNVCHHAFYDADGGRVIHFEGTYTNDFSGNPDKTPRYNYNQILYRLDVDAAAERLEK